MADEGMFWPASQHTQSSMLLPATAQTCPSVQGLRAELAMLWRAEGSTSLYEYIRTVLINFASFKCLALLMFASAEIDGSIL